MVVQPNVANALQQCAAFKSLESHTDTIVSFLPELAEHRESTLQTLISIRDQGVFESSEEAWARLTSGSTPASASQSCRIFITTCDRPKALKRLLASIGDTSLPNAIEGIWIIDDSRESASEQENAALIAEAKTLIPTPLIHVDLEYRQQLIQHLRNATNDDAALEWLIDRSHWGSLPTYGIARTLAVLLSVGKRAIVLDDDILLEAVSPPMAAGSLRLASGNEREAAFYASLEEMESHKLLAETPVLDTILGTLGHSVGSAFASQLRDHTALRGFNGHQLGRFKPDSPIIVTQCGSWGDTGTVSGSWISFMPEDSLKKLLATGSDIEGLLSAQAIWLGYRHPSISPWAIMSAATGLDNTKLLPPYLPAGRGEDSFFGILTHRLHPDSGVYNPAIAVPHLPIDERGGRSKLTPHRVTPDLKLFTDWIGREPADQWGLSPERRLRGITEEIRRLTEMDATALEELAGQILASKSASLLSNCVDHLQRLPQYEGQPGLPTWQSFLEQSRDKLVEQIQTTERTPLAKTGRKWAQDDFAGLREQGRAFAGALEQWADMREAASQFAL